jgi:hypothetical protein
VTRARLVLGFTASASLTTARLLGLAAAASLAVALLHVVLAFSVSLCRFCGAPEWLWAASTFVRVSVTLAVAAAFAALAAVPLLALTSEWRWPRVALAPVGALYTLRGLLLVPEVLVLAGLLRIDEVLPPQMPVFSAISLGIGLLHLAAFAAVRRVP